MKKMIIITIMAMTCGFLFANQASAGVAGKRIHNQKLRIRHGIITGKLTHSEARLLKREQRRIHRIKKIARTDGRLTYKERRRIEKLQNYASKHIYRLKHNPRRSQKHNHRRSQKHNHRRSHRGYRY